MNVTEHPKQRAIQRSVREDGICVLTFDHAGTTTNVLDEDTLLELEEELAFIERQPQLRGLVLASAKASIFIAGADLKAFRAGAPLDRVRRLIERGQALMNRLAALRVPTAAAIHGAALGGGFEICLACDYRVASTDRATRVGLPETQLGLLPAWGGSTRLPRLIGLPKALELVLGGKPLAAEDAFAWGLVDELAPVSELLDAAFRKIKAGKPHRSRHWLSNNPLMATWRARSIRRRVLARTRGHYPAPLKAVEVMTRGVVRPAESALTFEREAFQELVQTEACHNLVELFFLETRVKRPGRAEARVQAEPKPISRVAVIGAGVMGAGIAHWLSTRRVEVSLSDVSAEKLAQGRTRIESLYRDSVQRGLATPKEMEDGLARVHTAADEAAWQQADLVIEAAVEDLAAKKEIFRRLGERASPEAILATNTSALPVADLGQVTPRPHLVLGLHFFNPVHRMPLVEVISTPQTAPEVFERAVRFAQTIGKLPVRVKDSPGFVANRLLTPYLNEAQALFESGVPIEELDEAMLDFGLPMGPMRLLDEIGLDVELRIAETLAARFASRMAVPACLRELVQNDWTGRKSGRGFYLHDGSKRLRRNPALSGLARSQAGRRMSREELQERMVFPMVNEAARCLEEQIVAGPEDIDLVMVKGTGFAPFRGGPLRYADSLGAARLVGAMEHLEESGLARFAPCALLRNLAIHDRRFYDRTAPRDEEHESQAA